MSSKKPRILDSGSPARVSLPCRDRDNIEISMDKSPNGTSWRVSCLACDRNCDYSFYSPEPLSFAFVGKLVGVFFSPCRYFAKKAEEQAAKSQDGQLNLLSSAEE